jgi:hypothetical protein
MCRFHHFVLLGFFPLRLRWTLYSIAIATAFLYLALFTIVSITAFQLLNNPPINKANAVLILDNRAYLNGVPNP